MDRFNASSFFAIGQDIGRLATVRLGLPRSGIGVPLQRVFVALQFLVDPPNATFAISSARTHAQHLLDFVRTLLLNMEQNPMQPITADILARGNQLWTRFDTAIQAELEALHTYKVSQTLAWDTEILVQSAELILPE